jgi:hypothetical protein
MPRGRPNAPLPPLKRVKPDGMVDARMFRAFALVLSFFVGMLGYTAPVAPHDRDDSVAHGTSIGEFAINVAPRDQLEQGSGRAGISGEQRAVGNDDDSEMLAIAPYIAGADLHELSWGPGVASAWQSSERATAAARGPPILRA